MEASVKMLNPMTALALVTSFVDGGLLEQRWRDRSEGDEGSDAENEA